MAPRPSTGLVEPLGQPRPTSADLDQVGRGAKMHSSNSAAGVKPKSGNFDGGKFRRIQAPLLYVWLKQGARHLGIFSCAVAIMATEWVRIRVQCFLGDLIFFSALRQAAAPRRWPNGEPKMGFAEISPALDNLA
ncbi:hypothetical protein B0H19DRAFT_1059969 [Mycena capillaripes]|nr:hypothetical protein B0H19DRAFT_1059969 [Mycena capillaripes]